MKQIFSFVLMAAVVATSCNATGGDPNNFTVSGKISHAPSQNIFLEQIVYDNSAPKVVDSAKLAQDGTYKLKAVSKEQNLYLITIDHRPVSIFINDNNDIKVSADLNTNFSSPYISNSDATKSLYTFLNKFRSSDSSLAATYNVMDSLSKTNPNDSNILVLQSEGTQVLRSLTDYMKEFIQKSNSPAAIYYVLSIAASKNAVPVQELDSLATQASNRFKGHTGLAAMKTAIAQAETSSQTQGQGGASWVNKEAPNLTMNDINGKPVSISDFKGKYVLVDFWASWCGPCRQENPNVVAAYNKYKDKNFAILGVSLDQDKDSWVQAIKNDKLAWTQISDLKQWESAAVSTYQIQGIPFNVLIDPAGKVIAQELRGPQLEQKLAEVLQ
jgi:thiol-disulfide isomerase/thioredoxin